MVMLNSSSEAVVVTEQGTGIKTRSVNIRRIPEPERWDADRILGMRAVRWSPDGSDNAFDIQVGMGEALGDGAPRPRRGADVEQWQEPIFAEQTSNNGGLSEGCPGCRYLRTGQERQQAHSEAYRRRTGDLLKGDPVGSARLAAADERINRVLVDAVERHANKDPGTRGILKRTSVVRHPESESQKKIAMDTQQDPIPHLSVSHGGSSGSGTRASDTASNDPNTGTGDVTGGMRAGPAQDVTRVSREDDIGGDVVTEDSADENSARHTSFSGSISRRRITTKREPREVRDEQTSTSEQHVPEKDLGEDDAIRARSWCHHARGTGRLP